MRNFVLVGAVLVGRTHREFVHAHLAEQHCIFGQQLLHYGRVVGRNEAFQHLRTAGGGHSRGAKHVLDRQRQTAEQTTLALRQLFVRLLGSGHRLIRVQAQIRPDLVFHMVNPGQQRFGEGRRGDFPCRQLLLRLPQGEFI